MAENVFIDKNAGKAEKYKSLLPQIKALIEGETDITANLANISSALYFGMGFFWVGFYRLEPNNELILEPFHGPVACTRISYGKGVCGTAAKNSETIIVPDVNKFPGHIACSSESKSEIVVCIFQNKKVNRILDIDSNRLNDFDKTDQKYLEKLCDDIIEPMLTKA